MQLLQVVVQNAGLNMETFQVEFGYLEWDGTFVVKRTKTATDLPAGERKSISFGFYTFPANVEYNYFVRVLLDGDMNPENDVIYQAINSFETARNVVLIEKATGTWCGFCPGAARCVDQLNREYPGQVAAIDYHVGDEYENEQCRPRAAYYEVPGYPTAKFNGMTEIVGGSSAFGWEDLYYDSYRPRYRAALTHGSCLDMDVHYQEENGKISAGVTLTGLAKSYVDSYRIFYVVVESHIKESWGGLDSLQHVFRGVYPDWNGVQFISDQYIDEGLTFTNEIEFDFPQDVVKENSEIIAFVQNIKNRAVTVAAFGEKIEAPVIPFELSVQDSVATDTVGNEIVFTGMIHNLLDKELSITIHRTLNDIPEDWSSAICLDLCLAPWVDEAKAKIAAGDSLEFSLHVFSGSVVASGVVSLTISDSTGIMVDSVSFSATTVLPAAVADKKTVHSYKLSGNYPNPFNPSTTIEYHVGEMCTSAKLQVFSVSGKVVVEEKLHTVAGNHRYHFQPRQLSAGVYLYRVVFHSASGTIVSNPKKLTLLK